ncbi:MAK10-like protein [Tanacetum coccineum]
MGDENPIRTLGDYSKPTHEGYRNTIELPVGNNVIERLPAGSITTWEDLTTRFLAQFFPPERTAKLRNNILMFQQHHGESLSEVWTRFKDLLQKVPHHGIDLWLQVQIFYDHVNPVTRRTIDQSADGKLRVLNAEESWALLKDLALYDNESWNDPKDFAKPVKAIALPQDVASTSDRRLIELKNQVQRLMEAHLTPTQPTQVNKITTSCEVCSGPHDTQYCMEDPEQAFVEYASSRTDETGASITTEQVRKLNSLLESLGLVPQSSNTKFVCFKEDDGEVMFIEIIRDDDEPQNKGPNEGEGAAMEGPAIMRRKLNPMEDANRGVNNFTGKIKGMHVFVGNFTYIVDFMIIEDISSIIDPSLSQVVLGKPFVEISNMTHDPQEGVVMFTNGNNEVAYKIPHKIEQYNSLSNLGKEHTKPVYLRNEEDKRRGVEYVMSKILGFYKECLELGPEYLTGMEDEGEFT